MFTVWHGLFSLVLVLSGLIIEASPLSPVQGTYTCAILKQRIRKFNFRTCTKPSIGNIIFFLSKIGSLGANLLTIHAIMDKSIWPIYWPTVPQQSNQAVRFIVQTCQLDKIFTPINWPTTANWLSLMAFVARVDGLDPYFSHEPCQQTN